MNKLYINSLSAAAPGMPDWGTVSRILSGRERYKREPLERYKPQLLPPNERRRATNLIRLAFRVCEEVFQDNIEEASKTLSVFASSGGDCQIIDQICRVLSESERVLSPTQFHNSVHNSAAGYWSIAAKSMAASTSLCCYDYTFAAGLLEATSMALEAKRNTLLATYDIEINEPLARKRSILFPFAVALLLSPTKTKKSIASVSITLGQKETESICASAELETLRIGNPAARSLPMLELLSKKTDGDLILTLSEHMSILLELRHC